LIIVDHREFGSHDPFTPNGSKQHPKSLPKYSNGSLGVVELKAVPKLQNMFRLDLGQFFDVGANPQAALEVTIRKANDEHPGPHEVVLEAVCKSCQKQQDQQAVPEDGQCQPLSGFGRWNNAGCERGGSDHLPVATCKTN